MDFEYIVSDENIEKKKLELKNSFEELRMQKETLSNEIFSEKQKIYDIELNRILKKLNRGLDLYRKSVNLVYDNAKENFLKKYNKSMNQLFILDTNGNSNLMQKKNEMKILIENANIKASKYNKILDESKAYRKEITDNLDELKKYEDSKEEIFSNITTKKIRHLENELNKCINNINEFWIKNQLLSEENNNKINEIFSCNPQNKDVFDVKGILHLNNNEYIDKELGINIKYPLFKTSNNFSTIVTIKNKASIENLKTFVSVYLFRIIFALKASNLKISVIDEKENGLLFNNILALAKSYPNFIDENVIFDENGVTNFLNELNNLIINRSKNLNGTSLEEYNKTAYKKEEVCIFLVNNYEKVFKNNVKLFENLLKYGAKYGIYFILISDIDVEFLKYRELLTSIHKKNFISSNYELFSGCLDEDVKNIKNIIKLSCILSRIKVGNDKLLIYPSNSLLYNSENSKTPILQKYENISKNYYNENALNKLKENLDIYCNKMQEKEAENEKLNFDELLSKLPRNQTTEKMIKIPIGVNVKGEFEYIEFSDNAVDAILTGATGAGKSTFYHNLLLNSLYMYSPDELKIYILDLKEGIEFSMYSDYNLPNIEGIYGNRTNPVEILEYLSDEITRRSKLFIKEKNVKNIEEYRKLGKSMPRILLILDEFQIILGDSNTTNERAKECLTRIITQGRAEGIHIIICAQDISVTGSGLTDEIKQQLTTRILLRSVENSADLLLKSGNLNLQSEYERRNVINEILNLKKGIGIVNKNSGDIKDNVIFKFPYCTSDDIAKHLKFLSDENDKKGLISEIICKTEFEDYINKLEPLYYKNRYNLSKYPIAILAEYMKFKNEGIKVEFSENKNSNVFICTNSLSKSDSILASFFSCINIWNRYNKKRAKVYVFDFGNLSKSLVDKYINVYDSNYAEILKYEDNAEELSLKLDELKKNYENGIYSFVIVNRIDMFKEYSENPYDCDEKINDFIQKLIFCYENGMNYNINMITIYTDGPELIDKVTKTNSKIFLFENETIFSEEYYYNLFNKSSNILYKDIDKTPKTSVEVKLFMKE